MVPDSTAERARLLLMARKLMRFTPPYWPWWRSLWACGCGRGTASGAGGAGCTPSWLWCWLLWPTVYCARMLSRFERAGPMRSHVWYRVFNELPVLLLVKATSAGRVKPF